MKIIAEKVCNERSVKLFLRETWIGKESIK
jgi:hypothetical protein